MRKSDAERRTFLNDFKLKMVEIENASDARLGDLQVSESQIDYILSHVGKPILASITRIERLEAELAVANAKIARIEAFRNELAGDENLPDRYFFEGDDADIVEGLDAALADPAPQTPGPEVKTGDLTRLDAELLEYELAYQMTTVEFLLRVADPRDDLSDVEDATFWKATYEIAEKLRIDGDNGRER